MRAVVVIFGLIIPWLVSCGSQAAHDPSPISIEVGDLRPVEVGVLTPSKKFIYTYSDEFRCRGTTKMNWRILIEPASAVGYYWNPQGERLEVAVFEEVGVYTIYVSDNLETETENSSAITKGYVSQKRSMATMTPGSCQPVN